MKSLPALLLLAAAACSDDGGTTMTTCSGFVGDRAKAVEIEVIYLGPDGKPVAAEDGARLPMWKAPQGGKHVFIGARARNLDTCPVSILGSIRDTGSNAVRFEGRARGFLDGGDGWAYVKEQTEIDGYANVPLCGNFWSSRDIFDQSYELEMKISDKDGRMGSKKMTVTPYCSQPELLGECMCECHEGYKLGQTCAPDAGVPL